MLQWKCLSCSAPLFTSAARFFETARQCMALQQFYTSQCVSRKETQSAEKQVLVLLALATRVLVQQSTIREMMRAALVVLELAAAPP